MRTTSAHLKPPLLEVVNRRNISSDNCSAELYSIEARLRRILFFFLSTHNYVSPGKIWYTSYDPLHLLQTQYEFTYITIRSLHPICRVIKGSAKPRINAACETQADYKLNHSRVCNYCLKIQSRDCSFTEQPLKQADIIHERYSRLYAIIHYFHWYSQRQHDQQRTP